MVKLVVSLTVVKLVVVIACLSGPSGSWLLTVIVPAGLRPGEVVVSETGNCRGQ